MQVEEKGDPNKLLIDQKNQRINNSADVEPDFLDYFFYNE